MSGSGSILGQRGASEALRQGPVGSHLYLGGCLWQGVCEGLDWGEKEAGPRARGRGPAAARGGGGGWPCAPGSARCPVTHLVALRREPQPASAPPPWGRGERACSAGPGLPEAVPRGAGSGGICGVKRSGDPGSPQTVSFL